MSKFLTPPVWYDSNGNLVEILTGEISKRVTDSMAIGKGAYVQNSYSVAVGTNARTDDANAIVIGYNSECSGLGSIVIGSNSEALPRDPGTDPSIVIGNAGKVAGRRNIAIGENIKMGSNDFDSTGNIAIGRNSAVYGYGCIAIGEGIQLGGKTLGEEVSNIIQIGSSNTAYTFQVGNRNVFDEIEDNASKAAAAANTFSINDTPYKATYDSASATLNFITT